MEEKYNPEELEHHGIKGQKWGIRRFQNEDGTLTPEGKKRYVDEYRSLVKQLDYSNKNDRATVNKIERRINQIKKTLQETRDFENANKVKKTRQDKKLEKKTKKELAKITEKHLGKLEDSYDPKETNKSTKEFFESRISKLDSESNRLTTEIGKEETKNTLKKVGIAVGATVAAVTVYKLKQKYHPKDVPVNDNSSIDPQLYKKINDTMSNYDHKIVSDKLKAIDKYNGKIPNLDITKGKSAEDMFKEYNSIAKKQVDPLLYTRSPLKDVTSNVVKKNPIKNPSVDITKGKSATDILDDYKNGSLYKSNPIKNIAKPKNQNGLSGKVNGGVFKNPDASTAFKEYNKVKTPNQKLSELLDYDKIRYKNLDGGRAYMVKNEAGKKVLYKDPKFVDAQKMAVNLLDEIMANKKK